MRPGARRGCLNPLRGDSAYCADCYAYLLAQYHAPTSDDEVRAAARAASRKPVPWDFDYRLSRYSLTADQYLRLLAAQDGACGICRVRLGRYEFHIDHDHACCAGPTSCGGCVRGLLCRDCNLKLGAVEKDGFGVKALAYLEDKCRA